MSSKKSTKKVSKKQTVKSSTTEQRPAKRKKIVSLAQYEAEAKAEMKAAESTTAEVGAGSKEPVKADQPANERKLSGLDAAAQVLAEAGEPLNTKTMVERMLAKGLWQTDGKTPAATIYAAIIREIKTRGDQSRFRKVYRGRFELAKK